MNKLPERIRIKDIARLADVSVGTVDRVLHGRTGVSEASRKRVEEILKQLDYQPNMYASALASNKKYLFVCLLPQHKEGDYWTDVEMGMKRAVETFSDFHITLSVVYYDQYEYSSFINAGEDILRKEPDGVLLAPTIPEMTARFTNKLQEREIPYIFIDSNVDSLNPLAFFGQKSDQSGYFAARMAMMLGECPKEIVIFRQINEGRLGSNQQENREKGFRKYMQEHFPDCKIVELNLYAKRPDEDEALMNRFFQENPQPKQTLTSPPYTQARTTTARRSMTHHCRNLQKAFGKWESCRPLQYAHARKAVMKSYTVNAVTVHHCLQEQRP